MADVDPYAIYTGTVEKEFEEADRKVPQPGAPPEALDVPSVIPEKALEQAPLPQPGAPMDFTNRMREQGLLPDNWPEGVSVFQDTDLALSNLQPDKHEMLVRELLRFMPYTERDRFLNEFQEASGGGIIEFTPAEWSLLAPPKPLKWWEKGLGVLKDIAGKPVGEIMDALQVPSDTFERLASLPSSYAWYHDLDIGDIGSRWERGSMFYDIIGTSLQHGDFSGTYIKDVEADAAMGLPFYSDDPESPGIYQKHQNAAMDFVGKFIFDPLWLVGGVGILGKAEKGVTLMGKVGNIVKFGVIGGGEAPINLYRAASYEEATKLKVIGPIFKAARAVLGSKPRAMAEAEAITKSIERATNVMRALNRGQEPWWRRLFMTTPEYRADTLWRNSFSVFQVAARDEKTTPADMLKFVDSIHTGNVDDLPLHMPRLFAQNETAASLRDVMSAQSLRGGSFDSLRMVILSPNEYDQGLEAALVKGDKAANAFVKKAARGHEGWRNAFLEEVNQRVYKAIAATYDIKPDGVMQKLFGLNKRLLSTTTLNTPSFVLLNGLNNFATLFFDEGFSIFRKGWRKSTMIQNLKNIGLDESVIVANAGDHALGRFVGITEGGRIGQAVRPSKFSMLVPFVSMASSLDGWARLKAFELGVLRAYRHNWHGIAPELPRALLEGLSDAHVSMLRGLWNSSPDAFFMQHLDGAEAAIRKGQPLKHVGFLRDMWIDEMEKASGKVFDPKLRRLIEERFDSLGLVGHLQETMGAKDADEMLRLIDNLRANMQGDLDNVRDMQHLEPVGTLNVPSDVDLEALRQAQRDLKTQLTALPEGHPDIPRLQNEVGAATQRYNEARKAVNGSTGQNVHAMHIAEDKLGKTRVEFTDRWLRSHGFQEGTTAGAVLDNYLTETRKMYANWSDTRAKIFAAHQAGEANIDALWRNYERMRTDDLARNLDTLEKMIAAHNPALLPSFRVIRDARLQSMAGRDSALRAALEAGEDVRYFERADLLGPTRRRIHDWMNQEIRTERDLMGLSPRVQERNMGMYDGTPVMAEAITGENQWAMNFLDWAEPKMVNVFSSAPEVLEGSARAEALKWIDQMRGSYKDMQLTAINVGRAAADWTMLDYSRMYGIDKWLQWVMPYHFWPTRSMARWAQRTTSNPGAVASIALGWEMMQEMTKDLPERFEGDFEIPVPFLGDYMKAQFGPGTKMFFNPIPMMFPAMQWSQDWSFDSRQNTVPGRILDWMSNNGPAVHPFVPMAGSLVGLLDKREWLNRNWPRALPFGLPGTTAQMGVVAFLNGFDVDLPDWITDEDKTSLIGGNSLPLNKLQRLAGIPDDQWDTYRIDRTLAGLYTSRAAKVGAAGSKKLQRDYLDAMNSKSGPLWNEARSKASQEAGLRYITSWLFSPVQVYPEGEQMMRALDPVYRDYAARGDLDGFYERFPEYQTRHVALAGLEGQKAREEELHKTLFWLDLGVVLDGREQALKDVKSNLAAIRADEKFYNTGIGRTYRSLYEEEQAQIIKTWQDKVNQVYANYEDVDKTPSATHDPFTRALMSLRNDYYDMRMENYLPKGITTDDATPEQIAAAEDKLTQARDAFVLALPPERIDPTAKFTWSMRHQSLGLTAAEKINSAVKADKGAQIPPIIEQRNANQLSLMNSAKAVVSRYDFETFINRGKQPPSAVQVAYDQARTEMSQYMAMADLNIPKKSLSALRADYWETHPLLGRFYGNEPYDFSTSQAAASYARLDEIRATYYDLDGVARLDYIYSVLDELNELLDTLGLPVVQLQQIGIADERRWDLSIPGVGFPPAEKLEYSIEQRFSDVALSQETQ